MSHKSAVRIVNVDFYMVQPNPGHDVMYSEFRSSSVSQVPVIRIFGSTEQGKKICLHIHGVFPYLYIPYDGTEDANCLKFQIAANIDKAINISFGQASSNSQHVYRIELVSGIPFYGYHTHPHQFFKIYLYNPSIIRKVSNMLQSEVILGRLYQPHESHIPYILQFMIDFNLHGMSKAFLSDLTFRDNSDFPKQSCCELEADAACDSIMNKRQLVEGNLAANPGIAALWEDERQRLRLQGEDSQIGSCLTLENSQTEPTKSHFLFKQALEEKMLILSDESSDQSLSLSVYPVKTPKDSDFLSESMNESIDLNASFDENAKELFKILQDLGRRNIEPEENDSVLSQAVKQDEEEEIDLSLSMSETSPYKKLFEDLDATLVPQLDGQNDSDDESGTSKSTQKSKSKYGALPIVVLSPSCRGVDDVKRQLSFQSDVTVCETKIECQHRPAKSKNIVFSQKGEEKELIKLALANETKRTLSQQSEAKPALTVAELYDFQTNYKAKEGCSSKLTQESDLKLSAESNSDEIFSSLELDLNENSINLTQDAPSDFSSPPNGLCRSDKRSGCLITPLLKPPSRQEVLENLDSLKIPRVRYQKPFYSNPRDVTNSIEVGHNVLKIPSKSVSHLEECKTNFNGLEAYRKRKMPIDLKWTSENVKKAKLMHCSGNYCIIEPVRKPPTVQEVQNWIRQQSQTPKAEKKEARREKIVIVSSPGNSDCSDNELTMSLSPCEVNESPASPLVGKTSKKHKDNSCQITGVSLNNTYGFKATPVNYQDTLTKHEYLTLFSLEVHVRTRGDLKPDPAYDGVEAVFYTIFDDAPGEKLSSGIIGVGLRQGEFDCDSISVQTEDELFTEIVKLFHKCDPDILIGYETELLSWGFLLGRSLVLEKDLLPSLSRVKGKSSHTDEGLKITGRILLNVWRLMRHEISLQSYTFESIAYHLLRRRIPSFSFKDLSAWWLEPTLRHRTISHYMCRVRSVLEILEQLDLIGRTSELARLFGIQFYEVLSRGSQFRVESMMLRLAKPLNYVPVSPSVQQRAKMKAPEFLPLILEPESKLYVDPVIVLDFQSLYPSVMIAYNYCFSTCVGRVSQLGKNAPFEFGATQLKVSRRCLRRLLDEDRLNLSPCGVAFVKKQVRDGILPRMLREILETRLMVKSSMKKNKENKMLQRILHNRQLGLKLIANVTYGYTAANFSGRMPAVELADSVVGKGRETLQRAIELVEKTPEWKARVVYGDTDSMFVLCEGRTRKEAFDIGSKIAEAVTNANPDPVKIKLEKVYQPCILQTKKRYVGYMYEGPEQQEPVYEAKGIETVRRDGCPAVAKMLERCLRLLFETKDVSLIKQYVLRQFDKILTGRVSLQDLTFAKEYRGSGGYKPGACVPALELARKWTAVDRRNEPRRGERVPYVIINGPPGVPLIKLVRSPYDFLNNCSIRPNAIYYITKVIIPPINRCFTLIGADLNVWFNQMPRKHLRSLRNASPAKKSTISQYFVSTACAVCGEQTQKSLCRKCSGMKQRSVFMLHEKLRSWERASCEVNLICQSCTSVYENKCISLDCPVLYRVKQTSRDLEQAVYVREVIASLSF